VAKIEGFTLGEIQDDWVPVLDSHNRRLGYLEINPVQDDAGRYKMGYEKRRKLIKAVLAALNEAQKGGD